MVYFSLLSVSADSELKYSDVWAVMDSDFSLVFTQHLQFRVFQYKPVK